MSAAASDEPRRKIGRRGLRVLVAALSLALAFAGLRLAPLTTFGHGLIERAVSGLKVGRLGHLYLNGLRGDPWGAFSVRRVTLVDGKGIWLEVQGLRVDWRPSDLWHRQVHLERVTADKFLVLRRPILASYTPPGPSPVSVRLDRLAVRLETEPAFSSARGVFDAKGALEVDRSGAVKGTLRAISLLHAGDYLKFNFDAGDKRFSIDAHATEARGGALAGSVGLRADAPFLLDAQAHGALNAGAFSILATLGRDHPLDARGGWTAEGGTAEGRLDLSASSLLSDYSKALGPQARFRLSGRQGPASLYDVSLTIDSENMVLGAHGLIDAIHSATGPHGLAVTLRTGDAGRILRGPKLGAGRLQGVLLGNAGRWTLRGLASVDGVVLGDYGLAQIGGPFELTSDHSGVFLKANTQGKGGAGRGFIAGLLGGAPRGEVDLAWLPHGRTLVRKLEVQARGLAVAGVGQIGPLGDLSFKGGASLSNLSAASPNARGLVTMRWTASQGGAENDPWRLSADVKGDRFVAGFGAYDRFLGPAPRLRLDGVFQSGIFTITGSTLDAAAGSLAATGQVGPGGALNIALQWRADGPLDIGPLVIAGHANGAGTLGGDLAAPNADLTANFSTIDLQALSLRNAHLSLTLAAPVGNLEGRFNLTGATDYGPARASAAFHFNDGAVEITALDLHGAGITASGSIGLRGAEPFRANLAIAAGPGLFLSQGSVSGHLSVVAAPGGGAVDLNLQAANAILAEGGVAFRTLHLSAKGPLERLPYQVQAAGTAAGGPWKLTGGGLVTDAAQVHAVTFDGAGRMNRVDLHTLTPLSLDVGRDGLHLTGKFGLNPTGAVARLSGVAIINVSGFDGGLRGRASFTNLSLGLISPDYVGRFDGEMTLQGHGGQLSGGLEARMSGFGARDLKGVALLKGVVSGTLTPGALRLVGTLNDGQGSKAYADIILPAESAAAPFRIAIDRRRAMTGRFDIDGELAPLWDLTMGGGRTLAGHMVASGQVKGDLANPVIVGVAALDKGRFLDSGTGLKLQGVTLRAAFMEGGIDVSQFGASDGAKGSVAGAGRIDLRRDGASSFKLDLNAFRLLDNEIGQATASGTVAVNRAADGKVKLTGTLVLNRAQIAPNPPTPSGVVPMEVVEIHKPIVMEDQFAAVAVREAPVDLDVTLKSASGVFIKGRGLNVELSLDAHVTGSTADPRLRGVARVVRGDYDFAGKRFQFDDSGIVYLGSTAETIRLNLTARREDSNLTAVIHITETAAKPTITLTSTPVLPRDEVLSQVLFGASATSLNGLEAAQLASALSGLASGGGLDVMSGLRSFAHLDRLAVASSATGGGTTVAGGKYLTDKVYLEVSGGSREGPGAQVEWRVKKHLSLVSRVTSQGESQISVRWRHDY